MPYLHDIAARSKALAEARTLGNLHPDARAQAIARAGITDRDRMQWLHSAQSVDAEGYEWGVFRVKWENGRAVDVQRTRADNSDVDAVLAAGAPAVPLQDSDSVHLAADDSSRALRAASRGDAVGDPGSAPTQPEPPLWRPIETAPQDRTHVLLWVKTRWGKLIEAAPFTGWGRDGYWYGINADEAVQRVKPTHWMPLPPPPVRCDGPFGVNTDGGKSRE